MNVSFKTLFSSTVLVIASAAAFNAVAQAPNAPATLASPTAPAATATAGAHAPGKGLKALDTNNDKMISRDEAKLRPQLSKNFDAIDTNKDGQLTRAELKAYLLAHKGEATK